MLLNEAFTNWEPITKLKPVLQLKDFSWTAATLPQTSLSFSLSVADDLKCSWSMLNQYNENSTSLSVIFQMCHGGSGNFLNQL